MLDPAYLRDHQDEVKRGLESRGMNADGELEQLATLENRRRRLIPELEGLKREQNAAGDEVARAKRQGKDASAIFEANRQRAQQIRQLEIELDQVEQQRTNLLMALPNLPHASVPRRQERERQRRGAHVGRAESVRFRAAGALGSGTGAGHSGFRARDQDVGLAVCGAAWAPAPGCRAR